MRGLHLGFLLAAGAFEVLFVLALRSSDGFSRAVPAVACALAAAASVGSMSVALRGVPVGTAYAIWTGLGAAGTVVAGMVVLGEPVVASRLCGVALVVAGIATLALAA